MTCRFLIWITSLLAFVALANRADAIGWEPTDFLIGGGPNFTNKIGVFDANLNYRGNLDSSFLGVGGMDFDAAVKNIESSTEIFKSLLSDLQAGRGLAGSLLKNEELSAGVSQLVSNLTAVRGWNVVPSANSTFTSATWPPSAWYVYPVAPFLPSVPTVTLTL